MARRDPEAAEFTFPSPMVRVGEAARDFAAASFPPGGRCWRGCWT
ncbi:hypothetical protein [Roseomonas gilardii]